MPTQIWPTPGADPFHRFSTTDDSACELCGERFPGGVLEAEMYHPADRYASLASTICHVACGQRLGMIPA